MGVSKSYIRIGLQRGLLPFGTAVKMSGRYTYYISANRFYEYVGLKYTEYSEIERIEENEQLCYSGETAELERLYSRLPSQQIQGRTI